MKSAVLVVATLTLLFGPNAGSACAADYYLDGNKGDDGGSGRSPESSWRSLGALNRVVFKPGDRILVAAGSRYTGQLAPKGSGNNSAPIVIDVYGGNQKARIDGQGQVEAPLLLRNVEYWKIANLELTNEDPAASVRR